MDHDTLPTPQFELPKPAANRGEKPPVAEGDPANAHASEVRNMETPAFTAPVAPPTAQPAQAAQALSVPMAGDASSIIPGLAPAALPQIDEAILAEDGDLIEKAWVQKAKAIVEQTRHDPYNQNREINKVKKDYIQKRYQKDVKLTDE